MVSFLRFPLEAIARKSSFDVDVLLLSLVPSPVLNVPLGSSTLSCSTLSRTVLVEFIIYELSLDDGTVRNPGSES